MPNVERHPAGVNRGGMHGKRAPALQAGGRQRLLEVQMLYLHRPAFEPIHSGLRLFQHDVAEYLFFCNEERASLRRVSESRLATLRVSQRS